MYQADRRAVGLTRDQAGSLGWCLSLCLEKARQRREIVQQSELIMLPCVGQGREWEGDPNPECLFGGTSALLVVN